MILLFQNFITIFPQTKLTFKCLSKRKAINQSPDHAKYLTPIRFISSIACSSMGKITKRSELFNVVQGSCLIKSWEKRETSISTRANMLRLLITMKELSLFSSGWSISMRKIALKSLFREFLPNNPSGQVKIFPSTRDRRSISI